MKRIAIIAVTLLISLTASARSIRYFTLPQAQRTVSFLDQQNELMIYCGYDYEIETYVLVSEVWMERVNSSYYEVWLYGFDAYTGDEVYMPLDLQCVWLMGGGGRVYNAAQYLRFHASVRTPSMVWYIPPYNPYTRRPHAVVYVRSYHYDIHRHGWMPPAPPAHGWGPHTQPPLPPYYMRTPQAPAPAPTNKWTPGVDHPQVSNTPRNTGSTISTNRTSTTGSGTTTRSSGSTTSTTRSSSGTTTTRTTTGTTPTRTNTGTTTRNSNEGTTTRSSGTTTTRSSNEGTTTRSSGTTTTRSSNEGTTTRSSGTTTTRNSNEGSTTRSSGTTTTTRSSNSNTSRNNNAATSRTTNTVNKSTTERGSSTSRSTNNTERKSTSTTTRSTTTTRR